jgi:hypothetical protein
MRKLSLLVGAVLLTATVAVAQGTAPAGTDIVVTLNQAVNSKDAQVDQKLDGVVAENVVANGRTVIPKGAKATLLVTVAEASGRLSGQARLWMRIESLEVNGRVYTVESEPAGQDGPSHTKRNTIAIGGGAAAGTAIGAIAGGGKGAAIGAAVGAAAGTGAAAATGKKDVEFPAEAQLTFKLKSALTVQSAARASKGLKKGHRN